MMKPVKDYNEKELLLLVAEGNENAFRQLFHCYKEKIYSVALRISKSQTSAEELLQDIFLIIWLKREHLSQIEDFDSYLFIVARNEAYRAFKRLATEKRIAEETIKSIPLLHRETEETIALNDYSNLLIKAIDKLPPQQKKVYALIKEQGYTREQAAQILQIGAETVKTHMERAMKTIRTYCSTELQVALIALALTQTLP